MRGTILQPTYLPWMGYFEMISSTDIYVVFDHVQFARKSWQQRNRIKTSNGVIFLTVPVQKEERNTRICDIKISYDRENPLENHWKTISLSYGKSKFFNKYKSIFEEIYSKKHIFLRDLNVEIIKKICEILGIKTKFILSSELELIDQGNNTTEDVISLCKKIGITHLYDAKIAETFIDASLFQKENMAITFQEFKHPVYHQIWGGNFIPYLSIMDLLFNEGDNSMNIIKSGRIDLPKDEYSNLRQN